MHPEHPDPEAEILWMRQPGIKGTKLHGPDHATTGLQVRSIHGLEVGGWDELG
ncbi:MAG: hypothetical protein HF976_05815 [ANME-2 cluster archaeon]|nr:hypothetical protein [ANME-2 cluster archaeon]MBC2700920.1 hypothetical protein [ANME-2 cluster archaeon]MBC2709263.1 hypothetical protein [ANME-2 cluster archaeon]